MSGRRRLTRIIPLLLAAAVLLAAATALLLLSPTPGHAQTTDDCAGDTTTTCSVSPGSPVTGDIEVAGDDDYFSLSVTSGVTYQINLEGSETSKGTLGDPYLFLRDASDDTIVRDDDGGAGYNARLTWTADRTGTVYVRVEAAEVTDTGTLTVSAYLSTPSELAKQFVLSNFEVGAASTEIDVSTDVSTNFAKPYFLGFFPGDNPQGYYLTALELMVGANPNPGNSVTVELWRDYEEPDIFQPAARVATFTNPDAWVEGVNLLTLPEAVWVQPSPNTAPRQGKYFIKIASVTGPLPLALTFSHTYEDPSSAPNWMNRMSLATNQAGGATDLTVSFVYRLHGRINTGDGSVVASADAPAVTNPITDLHISNSSTAAGQTTYTLEWTRPAGTRSDYQYRYRNIATQNTDKAQVGETLTADTSGIGDEDGLTNAAYTYQWQADGADISSATSDTYTLADSDEGKVISVAVSFTDDAGNGETLTSAATDAVEAKPNTPATGEPTISGTAQVGQTLTAATSGIADDDGLDNVAFSYQWQADDSNISGATGETYALADADIGKAISVAVSFTDDAGNGETLTSAATDAVEAKPNTPATGEPTISGTAQVGQTLTAATSGIADDDGLDNVAFSYQWQADDSNISGATGETYALADADIGKAISVAVSFTDDRGNDETLTSAASAAVEAKSNSPATGQPAISGTALVGETLTADTSGIADEDGLDSVSYSYQWISNDGSTDSEIGGATGSTYILASDDVGKTIKVRVSFTDDRGHQEQLTSAATDAVAGLPPPPLTVSVENAAASHDGESVFTFELRFSEEFGLSYKTLRDHAFTVTGGTVKKAQRLEQGSNMGLKDTVRPDGNGDVTITLPITEDCDAQGAICTGDGRKLSHRLELTVGGPGQ